jgi:hypothetical protein
VPTKDYEGIVTSVAVPSYDLPDGKPYFVFSMLKPAYQPPDTPANNVPVFYVALEKPYAQNIMTLVLRAYELGLDVQVGLAQGLPMHVAWVQLPRAPILPACANDSQ